MFHSNLFLGPETSVAATIGLERWKSGKHRTMGSAQTAIARSGKDGSLGCETEVMTS